MFRYFLLVIALCLQALAQSEVQYVNKTFFPATTLLYSQGSDGSMAMRCTATAIEKNKTGYVFVTAAHCACEDNTDRLTVSPEKTFFYITPDEKGDKEFMKAEPIGCGYRHAGDDFALFQVDTTKQFPVVALGKDPEVMEPVVNIASPLGLGKQVFSGTVSAVALGRPVVEDDINWTNATLLQLFGTDGGSSGSAVVCVDQQAICSFVVGSINKSSIVAMPVSRLIKLRQSLDAGTYRHWKKNPDEFSDDQDAAPKKQPHKTSGTQSEN